VTAPAYTAALAILLTASLAPAALAQGNVSDRELNHPPYYTGRKPGAEARIAWFPVAYQRGGSQAPIFDPEGKAGSPTAALVASLNAMLDSLGAAAGWVRLDPPPKGTPPDVYFGCQRDSSEDCIELGDSALGRGSTRMLLSLRSPSRGWNATATRAMDSAGVTHALLITLEVGQYWLRQTGFTGRKSVELGSDHVTQTPWLTSLETPVTVLQLTGAVLNAKGRGVRIGAEGFMALRTTLPVSAFEAQRIMVDEDVERARAVRRKDLSGQPLAWRVALCRLLGGLTAPPPCGPPARGK